MHGDFLVPMLSGFEHIDELRDRGTQNGKQTGEAFLAGCGLPIQLGLYDSRMTFEPVNEKTLRVDCHVD
jgi:hypothetical protein